MTIANPHAHIDKDDRNEYAGWGSVLAGHRNDTAEPSSNANVCDAATEIYL